MRISKKDAAITLCGTKREILFLYEEESNSIYETMSCGRAYQADEDPRL